jgi:hypothetical protein
MHERLPCDKVFRPRESAAEAGAVQTLRDFAGCLAYENATRILTNENRE